MGCPRHVGPSSEEASVLDLVPLLRLNPLEEKLNLRSVHQQPQFNYLALLHKKKKIALSSFTLISFWVRMSLISQTLR